MLFVVISDQSIIGPFDTFDDAWQYIKDRQLKGYMIRNMIEPVEG